MSSYSKPRIDYNRFVRRKVLILIILCAGLFGLAIFSIGQGSAHVSVSEIFKTFIGQGEARSTTVVMGVRVPRVTTAILVGAILAIAGVVMQSVLKNPLASASTLGVSNGASFGATIAIIVFSAGIQNSTSAANAISVTNPFLVNTCAFIGGIGATIIIIALSRIKQVGQQGLVLAGVALSAIFSGASTLIQYFADDVQVAAVVFWTCDKILFIKDSEVYSYGGHDTMTAGIISDVYHLRSEVIDYNGIKLVVPLPDEPYCENEGKGKITPDPLHVAAGG